jgi:hypothetical protein
LSMITIIRCILYFWKIDDSLLFAIYWKEYTACIDEYLQAECRHISKQYHRRCFTLPLTSTTNLYSLISLSWWARYRKYFFWLLLLDDMFSGIREDWFWHMPKRPHLPPVLKQRRIRYYRLCSALNSLFGLSLISCHVSYRWSIGNRYSHSNKTSHR